jgi:MFS family permease
MGAYFAVRFCQVIVGSVVPGVIATFGVSRGTVGLALTGMWVVYAAVQLPSGVLADSYGERTVVVVAMLLLGTATLGLAIAPVFSLFVVAVAAMGGAAGMYYNPATTLLDRTSDGMGQTIGLHRVGAQVAGVVAPATAAVAALRYGWRTTVVIATVSALLAIGAFVVATRATPPAPRGSEPPSFTVAWLSGRHSLTSTAMMTLVEFVTVAAMAFLPTVFLERHGVAASGANLLFALFFAVAAVSQPLAGWLSDRYGRDRTIAALAGAGILGYGGLAVGASTLLLGVAVGFAGLAMGSTPVIQSRLLDDLSPEERGAGFGVFRTVYLLLGASGTVATGTVADRAGWDVATGLLGLCFLLILVVACVPTSTKLR